MTTATVRPSQAPAERRNRRRIVVFRASLSVLSGAMLGLSFPPSTFGILACFGLVPLLIVLADLDRTWPALRYSYLAMVVFHIITVNWTGGYSHGNDPYMMIAGGVTMIVHPLFYLLPLGAYAETRKRFGDLVSLAALPLYWTGYEYSHSVSEWSFPWLTLGNSQSFDLTGIQFISVTGVFGLSFWIVIVNCMVFVLYSRFASGVWNPRSRQSIVMCLAIVAVFFLPRLHGMLVLGEAGGGAASSSMHGEPTVTIGMIQSNVDPWDKWSRTGDATIRLYAGLTDSLLASESNCKPDIVLWPETAIPVYLLAPSQAGALERLRQRVTGWDVALLTGLPHAVVYRDSNLAPRSAKRDRRTGQRYDAFNAAGFIQPSLDSIQWYGKMKMVPLAERVPYADAFHFLDFLRWDVGIGGWQIGRDTTVFTDRRTGARFSSMICYESTYPGFVAEFVRKGAEFLSIITIDSWWGRMSGAFQHRRFAVFRAIENRRWIARCAVGGISCYIDPYGRSYDDTELFTRAVLCKAIGRSSDLTFYTAHGDLLGQACLLISAFLIAAVIGQAFLRKRREQSWTLT